ncbi:uncharacterized protein LOC123322812 [Coccinella septempunctata]|uniref:uncharacterized protein LOC123322812 n=1 Tax=Coccinella septempunctata TaxID=41139 RepID=UPI001D07FBD1|nr:uncharacterized protein LOC123322812 [Coccinella septempunctata]
MQPEKTPSFAHKCSLCLSTFTRKSSFKRHVQNFHPDREDELLHDHNKKFKCDKCNKTFTYKNSLRQHKRRIHKVVNPISNFQHVCVFCKYTNCERCNIIKHYEENHHIGIESEVHVFKDKIEFEKWKKEMEKQTSAFFRKTCSHNDPRNGFKKFKFFCNRSGYYQPKGKGVRRIKTQSLKIGGICPAEIDVVVYDDGKHFVKYVKTHCGHKNDFQDLHLSKDQKESIAVKIAAGVPYRIILDEVRDSLKSDTKLERAQLISRKDLYNIAKCFQVENELKVPVDGLSIEEWVKEMNLRGSVIYYKLKGSFCNLYINLRDDDFVIIIMNQCQLEILLKYASKCVCIDRTHFLNNDQMELISILVVDDEQKGFPCAFLISNRIDDETISIFYTCIRAKIGKSLETTTFMSDIDSIFYSSWLEVMGTPYSRFFCPWHVEKSWRDIIQKIKSSSRQSEAFEHLKFLQQIEDAEDFDDSLDEFLEVWTLKETIEFSYQFQTKFMDNRMFWAQYYRTRDEISLCTSLNELHEEISKLFVFGKNKNRLNSAVTSLMNFVTKRLLEKVSRSESASQDNACILGKQNVVNQK